MRQVLARQRQPRGGFRRRQRQRPALRCLDHIGWAIDIEIGDQAQAHHLFHRLVGRPVLAHTDAVMGHHIDDPDLLERGQSDRVAAIIAEDQEGAAIRHDPAMQRHAIHRRRHAEFADAVINVAAGIIVSRHRQGRRRLGVVRSGQIGRTADQLRDRRGQRAKRHFGRLAGRHLLRIAGEICDVTFDRSRNEAGDRLHLGDKGVLVIGGFEPPGPGAVCCPARLTREAPTGQNVSRDDERFVVPAQRFTRGGHFACAERCAVDTAGALLVGRALADHGAAGDQRGARIGLGFLQGAFNISEIVAVTIGNVPARGTIARLDVF